MKHTFLNVALATLLTFPVYLGLANNPTIDDGFLYGSAWELFQPLFDIGQVVGITRHAAIVIGTMFVVSFNLALSAVAITRRGARYVLVRIGANRCESVRIGAIPRATPCVRRDHPADKHKGERSIRP